MALRGNINGSTLRATINKTKDFSPTEDIEVNQNSTLVPTEEGSKDIGNALTDKLIKGAKTPDEAKGVIITSKDAQKDADANKSLLDAVDVVNETNVGSTLNGSIGLDKTQPPVPTFSKDDILVDSFMYDADAKQRMAAESQFEALKAKRNAASPVLEQLGVQDYYPDLSKDIQVGTISSQMLGSRGRYVAQGGLIPWGVVDARARAIDKDAREKAAIADKVKNTHLITSTQYQQQYDDYYFDKQHEFLDMAGGDATLLLDQRTELGREYLDFSIKMENAYKENLAIDKVIDDLYARQAKGDTIPPDTLKLMDSYSTGRLPMDDYLKGKGRNVSELADQLKGYSNATTWAQEILPNLKTEKDVMPMKAGVDFSNPLVAQNAKDAFTFKSGQSYDEYISTISKYFDVSRVNEIVNAGFAEHNFYKGKTQKQQDKIKGQVVSYISNSLGKEIEQKITTVNNDKLGWFNARQSAKEWEYKVDQDQTYFNKVEEISKTKTAPAYTSIFSNVWSDSKIPLSKKLETIQKRMNDVSAENGLKPLVNSKGQNILGHCATIVPMLDSDKGIEVSSPVATTSIMVKYKGKDVKRTISHLAQHINEYNLTDSQKETIRKDINRGYVTITPETQYTYGAVVGKNGLMPVDVADLHFKSEDIQNIVGTQGRSNAGYSVTEKNDTQTTTHEEGKGNLNYFIEVNNSSQQGQQQLNAGFGTQATKMLNTETKGE